MKISIKGLNKIDILLALYDNVTYDGIDCASAPAMPIIILKTIVSKRGKGLP